MVILSISSPGAVSTATDGVGTVDGTVLRSSTAMRSKTGTHSMNFCWRKIRIVGYHGLSSRTESQRQSGVVSAIIRDD